MSHPGKSPAATHKTRPKNHRTESSVEHAKAGSLPPSSPELIPGSQPPGSDAYFGRTHASVPTGGGGGAGRPAPAGSPPGSAEYFGRSATGAPPGATAGGQQSRSPMARTTSAALGHGSPASPAPADAPLAVGHPPGGAAYFGGAAPMAGARSQTGYAAPRGAAAGSSAPGTGQLGPRRVSAPVGQPPGSAAYYGEESGSERQARRPT